MVGYALDMLTRERDRIHPAEAGTERPPACISAPDGDGQGREIAGVSAVRPVVGLAVGACERCAETGRTCPSCVQRRRYVWSLVIERGKTFEAAGKIIGLEPEFVRELVDAENDRRELRSLRCDSIPVHRTQVVIAEALARDPDLNVAEIARWMDMPHADFERAFLGRGRSGEAKRRVSVVKASRLMIALGRAPNELEGC